MSISHVRATIQRDLAAVTSRDPAARSAVEVLLCYPGLHAIWGARLSHRLWSSDRRLLARLVSTATRWLTGVEIHPGAQIGPGLFIDHAMGVVIGETAEVGSDVTMYHGVTLGGTSLSRGKRHPTVGDRVTIGAGAKVLGPITIGHDSRIGANAVVVKDVPPNSVVVGVPGQILMRRRPRPLDGTLDLEDTLMPDLVGSSLLELSGRVASLETAVHGEAVTASVRPSDNGIWESEDFSI